MKLQPDSNIQHNPFNSPCWIFPRYRVRALADAKAKTWLFIISRDLDRKPVARDLGELPLDYHNWTQDVAELYGLAMAHRWLSANVGSGFEVTMINTAPRQESQKKERRVAA